MILRLASWPDTLVTRIYTPGPVPKTPRLPDGALYVLTPERTSYGDPSPVSACSGTSVPGFQLPPFQGFMQ